ncbi:hypothetical protein ACN38_g6055 [Penicillium nordicum]|uniref:Uncharacterized protein n=1 Tax=Penicillium nordicum TaxID=229535 RepID=A0A0M8P8T1_9EURO|nr:hypothetical protein ACN38_g6055 [Penicillium nordicum]
MPWIGLNFDLGISTTIFIKYKALYFLFCFVLLMAIIFQVSNVVCILPSNKVLVQQTTQKSLEGKVADLQIEK